MAAQQAHLQDLIANESSLPQPQYSKGHVFDDIPTEDGMVKLKDLENGLRSSVRHQHDLGKAIIDQAAPGGINHPGGAGNAAVQAEHTSRNMAGYHFIRSSLDPNSDIYRTFSALPFLNDGIACWTYLNGPSIVYLAPDAAAANAHKKKVLTFTYQDLPSHKRDKSQVLHFKQLVYNHNPKLHPNFIIPAADLLHTYVYGLHPEARVDAIRIYNSPALQVQHNCVFPALIPAYMPNAGAVHPNAGTLSVDLFSKYLHREFNIKLDAEVFRLKGPPAINLASDSPGTSQDALADASPDMPNTDVASVRNDAFANLSHSSDKFVYFSWSDVDRSKFTNHTDYVYAVFARDASTLKTCKNCGGVNHLAYKDGKLVCPTSPGSVPIDILKQIKYPVGVSPWRFGPGGKGKGKGRGRGGDGRGRGGLNLQVDGDAEPEPAPEIEPIWEDFDGWNDEE